MEFPQYRKYKKIKTYFRINSEKSFDELTLMGQKYLLHSVEAIQYPEMIRVQDMLKNENEMWEIISAKEFEEQYTYALDNLEKVGG